MFPTCSELTPRAPIPDGRMAQFMQPCNLSDFVHGRLLVKCLWQEFSMFIFSFLLNFSLKLLKGTFSAETMGAYVTRGKWILLKMFSINAFKHHLTIKGLKGNQLFVK